MKSRQKGKKKGYSKERVFGCDLQEHLQHSGQDGKQANRSRGQLGGRVGGLPGNHQACLLLLDLVCWAESASRDQWPRVSIRENLCTDKTGNVAR